MDVLQPIDEGLLGWLVQDRRVGQERDAARERS